MSAAVAQSPAGSTPNLENVEAKSDQLTRAIGRLIEEARAGSPGSLILVDALLDAGLQALLKPSNLCGLQVTDVDLGWQERFRVDLGTQVSFTIPKGMSGKSVIDLVEKANPRSHGYGVVWPVSVLLKDAGLEDIVSEDTKYTFTVCTNSNNRNRSQHDTYLAENGLDSVPRWVLTVGAALFRDRKGFPRERLDLATAHDEGDLFKGMIVMARSGGVGSCSGGLCDYDLYDDYADDLIVVAGAPLPNQK